MSTVIYGMLREEKQRNLERQEAYLREIGALPKGSVVVKTINGKRYHYLQYREKGGVKSVYIGNCITEIDCIKSKIEERKHLQDILKRLKLEYKEICKVVKE
ncbi:MAG: hypothetical protein LBC73_02540 [Oscillospiraceae bacterium]|jgi:hypothetical protein|nr:hypothetical protein [Oscillospiraceae bacterium]